MSFDELTEDDLDDFLGWLDDGEQYYLDKAKSARQSKAAAQHTVRLLRQWRLETAPVGEGGANSHFGVSPSDIAHCPTIREALAVIACGSNGYLRYRIAAKIIMEAELSSSKNVDHLAKDLLERVKRDKDWKWHSRGVYCYLPYTRRDSERTRSGKAADLVPVSTAHLPASPHFRGGAEGLS